MHAEVFTKDLCSYCVQAKMLLERRGVTYTEISAVEHRETLFERVTKDSGKAPTSVPQIYLDGKFIGGYDQLAAYFKKMDFDADDCN